MATLTEALTPSQRRAYIEVCELCRRAAPHLERLRIGGFPQEQDEERLAHLLKCAEGVMMYENSFVGSLGQNNGRTADGNSGNAATSGNDDG